MCLYSINWALLVGFHGRYWYQSFIDGSNIWCMDRTDPWGPEMDHRPLGRSYLVVVPSYDMACALTLLTGLYGWNSMGDIDINPSSMGPIFGVWNLTHRVPLRKSMHMIYHTTALLPNSCDPMADGPFRDPKGRSYQHPKYWTHRWRIDINIGRGISPIGSS